jgi:hypothetical protein
MYVCTYVSRLCMYGTESSLDDSRYACMRVRTRTYVGYVCMGQRARFDVLRYVCMCMRTYVGYVCMVQRAHFHCSEVCMFECMYVRMYVMYVRHVEAIDRLHIQTCIRMQTQIYIDILIYTHTCIHTHIHIS